MFLFSGAFFPISNLPPVLEWLARLTPLWHGVDLTRMSPSARWTGRRPSCTSPTCVALALAGYWWVGAPARRGGWS